jgi:DNA replication protein DnaC
MELHDLLHDEKRTLVQWRLARLRREHDGDERKIPQSERERARTAPATDEELERLDRWMSARARAQENPDADLVPEPQCPTCRDRKWLRYDVPHDHPDFGRVERCPDCASNSHAAWLRRNSGLSERELALTLMSWQPGQWAGQPPQVAQRRRKQRGLVTEMLKLVAGGMGDGLYTLYGEYGAGKSFALKIVTAECVRMGTEAYYVALPFLLDHLREGMYDDNPKFAALWDRVLKVPVLCLDEVTRCNPTPWARERVWMLADERYNRRGELLTVFATNINPEGVPGDDDMGYLFSRMSEGLLMQLEGDMRPVVGVRA